MGRLASTCSAAVLTLALLPGCAAPVPEVAVLRAPDGAKLPEVVVDGAGTLHLVYYTGSMSSGDLWHVTRAPDAAEWSAPRRVNSEPHSVHGLGPIDGGQLAIGPDGVLHAVWFHKDPNHFYYARTTGDTGGFGEQQTLSMKEEGAIEAAPAVTVDGSGNVYVFWHADAVEDAHRRVYMTMSRGHGAGFDPPRPVSPAASGACGCCGLRAVADRAGSVHLSYRGAGDNIRRGMRLLTSTDQGHTFTDQLIQPWEIGACPVATTTLSAGPDAALVAWETEGEIFFADIERLDTPVSPPGEAEFRRKNATVATNHRGDILLAWGDGPGWQSGGTLHWRFFDADGRPRGEEGGAPDPIPARSIPAAAARPDGSFVVVF